MRSHQVNKGASEREFLFLSTAITSLLALSIDTLLPAMRSIGLELRTENENSIQLIITAVLLSTAIGGLAAGPLTDKFGRRNVAFFSCALFLAGCALAAIAPNFKALIAARLLQGLGIAGSRVAVQAMIRDRFSGNSLARFLSFKSALFLLIPVTAPALGQWIEQLLGWRSIFYAQALIASIAFSWLAIRQPETLVKKNTYRGRTPLLASYSLIWRIPQARRYTLASCLALTPLMAYLSLAPQLLQEQYQFGESFPLAFACLAIPVGITTIANGFFVKRLGARLLLRIGLISGTSTSIAFLPCVWAYSGHPPTVMMIGYLLLAQASLGAIISNLTSLAMEPLGDHAGAGAAMYGAVATGTSALIAAFVASMYDGSPMPLVAVTTASGLGALFITQFPKDDRISPHHYL